MITKELGLLLPVVLFYLRKIVFSLKNKSESAINISQ